MLGDYNRKIAAWTRAKHAGLSGVLLATKPGDEARIDDFGHMILWSEYGNAQSPYGWEIDHQYPSALGGSDHHTNLRALHCKANRSLGGLLGNALGNLRSQSR